MNDRLVRLPPSKAWGANDCGQPNADLGLQLTAMQRLRSFVSVGPTVR